MAVENENDGKNENENENGGSNELWVDLDDS